MLWIGLGVAGLIFLALLAIVVLKMVAWFSQFMQKLIMFGLKALFFVLGPVLLAGAVLIGTVNLQLATVTFFVTLAAIIIVKAIRK